MTARANAADGSGWSAPPSGWRRAAIVACWTAAFPALGLGAWCALIAVLVATTIRRFLWPGNALAPARRRAARSGVTSHDRLSRHATA